MIEGRQEGNASVLITSELGGRPVRPIQSSFMNSVIVDLQFKNADDPLHLHCFQRLIQAAIELTGAHSAGVSVLEAQTSQVLLWRAVAGRWARFVDRSMPRQESPCGLALERKDLLLVARPERRFKRLLGIDPAMVEGMFTPFFRGGEPVGVIWALAHDAQVRFDAQDAFMLKELAALATFSVERPESA